MTELEHVEIEGFKGLEHVEFEPTDINLITGRNNTGKTSFLEAVDLLFNPENLRDFEGNLDSVVHVDYNRSDIQGRTTELEVKTAFRKPSATETESYFSEIFPVTIERKSSLSSFKYMVENEEEADIDNGLEEVDDIIDTVGAQIRDFLQRELSKEVVSDLQEELLLLSTDSNNYPYFLDGKRSASIMKSAAKAVEEELGQKITIDKVNTGFSRRTPIWYLEIPSERLQVGLAPESSFIKHPENTNLSTFIESTKPTKSITHNDEERDPIKIDDIGDFIKRNGILPNLKTFTFDYLVLQEEGSKRQIPYDFMGDGFKSIVGLLWELMDEEAENNIVLLEEPENHMHPGYVREMVYFLIDLAREEDVQLFITTHDSDFINDFFTENLTDEEETYLEEEFSLLRMEEDSAVVEDYETARENLKDLHLDLRGI